MAPMIQVAIAAGVMLAVMLVIALLLARYVRRVPSDQALIVLKMRAEPRVVFDGGVLVLPIVNDANAIDLTRKHVVIARLGKEGAHFVDGIRADVKVTFGIRVNRTTHDVLRVAQSIGAKRAAQIETLEDLFTAKFSEAIKIAFGSFHFEDSVSRRDEIRDRIIQVVGNDLDGFVLDDVSIDFLEQTPLEVLDPNNVIDARGIEKIRSLSTKSPADIAVPTERWSTELDRNGLRDVRVVVEISCDIVARDPIRVTLRDATDVLGGRVSTSILSSAGDGELWCEGSQATLRWTNIDVTADQLVAGAKIISALRTEPAGYR